MDAGVFASTEKGTPQGGVASPLLANIALHGMEQVISSYHKGQEKALLVRYADDVRHLTHCLIPLGERRSSEETTSGSLNQPGRESRRGQSHVGKAVMV